MTTSTRWEPSGACRITPWAAVPKLRSITVPVTTCRLKSRTDQANNRTGAVRKDCEAPSVAILAQRLRCSDKLESRSNRSLPSVAMPRS